MQPQVRAGAEHWHTDIHFGIYSVCFCSPEALFVAEPTTSEWMKQLCFCVQMSVLQQLPIDKAGGWSTAGLRSADNFFV